MAKYRSKFTSQEIDNQLEAVSEKIGAEYFDPTTNTKLNFKDANTLAEWLTTGDDSLIQSRLPYNFTGTQYQVKIISEMPSKNLYFTTQAEKAEITVSFLSQKKGITDVSWQDIVEDYNVSVYIDRGSTGVFTPLILDQFVMSGNSFTFDVRKSLATGPNRIRIVPVGSESADKAQGSEMFIVSLTSMYLAPSNFTWYKPFIEGETYILGGMNIGGSGLNKILKIRVSKEGYEKLYEIAYGTGINTDTAYTFNGLEFPSAGTGVYNVELWLDANGLESEHLSYNIICVSQADKFTAQLVAIGSPSKVIYNFSDNKLFEYSIYNGGTATGTPHIKVSSIVNTNPMVLIDEDLVDVATASPLTYTASLEIEMEDESATLQLEAFMTYGNEQQIIYPVDNSKSYPATTGAVFYMNPSSRNNAQSNREKVINSITGAEIDAVFTRMAWTDGTDGWTTDEEGRKCLRLPAGCTMDLAYQPMASVAQKTIELVYKVKNAADYDEPIFSICSDENDPNFRGIVIRPKNILIHSRDLNVNDSLQDYNTTDEETLHVLITIIPNYKTNYGNLAQIYVNGDKVRSFSFETADRWDVAANMKFGSETADTYWYKARVYDKGFEMYDASKNRINSLPDTKAKEEAKAKMEAPLDDSYNLSYDECVKNGLNTMVIEILDQDQTVPSISNPSAKQCNLWVKINNPIDGELDEDFARFFSGEIIENQTIEGQGTTAMTYARWNFRWKLTSAYNKRRITAKKNVASSPHANKMGGTRAYNNLYMRVVGQNDAGARMAVYQYPVYGFQKIKVEGTTDQYTYVPIGLYTIGPDKGDKKTFGYNDARFEDTVIHMEGTDHTPKAVGMDYPWEELAYSGSAEALGAVNATGNVVAAWEVGAAGKYDPKDNPTEVKAMLDAEFKPAYNVAEHNSTYILGVTETLAEMNVDIITWQAKQDAFGRAYAGLEFFTDEVYDLYFYNIRTQKYEARGINMLTDLGLTTNDVDGLLLDEKTELFKAKRRERFAAEWGNYWHKDSAIFNYSFLEMIGATDNFKKNSYPQKFRALIDGGRWEWRNDDLDSLMDIINQGLAGKLYSILVGDKDATGSIYAGDNSAFWTLIKETQQVEIKAMVHRIFDAMVELSPYGSNTLEKLVGFVCYYFWDKAQNYFPTTAYCKDAEWTYEDTWAAGLYKEVNPLSQSLGGHYEAQRDWITMRMLFMAMYYNYGPFGVVNDSFSDTSTGQIVYGGADAHTFDIEMACDGNPTILRGQSEYVSVGRRVKEGEIVQLTVPDSTSTDTRIYMQGVDWYKSIGDLCTLIVSSKNPTLSLASKRMQNFKIGDEDASKVTTNVQGLTFGDCPSMMIVDARNAKSLTGSIDLSKMPRLLEAYFGGTGVKAVNVPNGSKIAVLDLGEETTQISLMNLKFMSLEGFRYSELPKLEFLRIENCSQLNPFTMLKEIYNTDGNVIRDIRIIGFDVDGDASDVTMIANLANDVDKDGNPHIYNGIDAEGKPMDNSHPIIEGRLRINGRIYEDDYAALKAVFANLAMEFLGFYVSIKDPKVLEVLLANITTDDGVGLTTEDIEGVTSIADWFKSNTVISSFNEFSRFKGVTSLQQSAFYGCTALTEITLPDNLITIQEGTSSVGAFRGCVALKKVIANGVNYIGRSAFYGCANLEELSIDWTKVTYIGTEILAGCDALTFDFLDLESLTSMSYNALKGARVRRLNLGKLTNLPTSGTTYANYGDTSVLEDVVLGEVTNIPDNSFYRYSTLKNVTMPNVKKIGAQSFYECTSLLSIENFDNVTDIGARAFCNCSSLSIELNAPNLLTINLGAFKNAAITKVTNLGKITQLSGSSSSLQGTFAGCSELNEVVLPSTCTVISESEFYGCTKLRTINLENLTYIGNQCFVNCEALEIDVKLPRIETLGTSSNTAIFKYSGIKSVDFTGSSIETIYSSSNSAMGMFYGCKNLTDVILNEGLKEIQQSAFNACEKLDNVYFPESLETIGQSSFGGTSFLNKDVVIKGLKTFSGYNTFKSAKMRSVILPKIETMAGSANSAMGSFATCTNLQYVLLGDSLTSMGAAEFLGCTKLNAFICLASTVPTMAGDCFSGTPIRSKVGYIYVPDESVEAYKNATNWSKDATQIKGLSQLGVDFPEIAKEVVEYTGILFADPAVEAICLANFDTDGNGVLMKSEAEAVTSLGTAFKDNTEIVSFNELRYFTGLTSIGNEAFYNCTALNSISFPETVTKIGEKAFSGCGLLNSDLVLRNITELGPGAFYGTNLRSVIMPDIVKVSSGYSDGYNAFGRCPNLEYVLFGKNTESIAPYTFKNAAKCAMIVLATTPPTFNGDSFDYNGSPASIYVPDASETAYEAATNWSRYASSIKPISQLATDNPTLYAEIEEYL